MSKGKKIIYWIATVWLCLGMLSSGIVQLLQMPEENAFIIKLGYPVYMLPLLGVWKVLGVIVVLIPRYPLLKEWAYAGFFFAMSGALYSHLAMSSPLVDVFPPVLLLLLIGVSWYFRPPGRKLTIHN